MSKSKRFWIAHDNDPVCPFVRVYAGRKPQTMTRRRRDYVRLAILCLIEFTKATGITLKPGEIKAVWLTEEKPTS